MDDWNIICDFDGTITPLDITDAILRKFAPPEWEEVEERWLRGEITARQCMEQQVAMIQTPVRGLNAFLDSMELAGGFREFVRFCRKRGLSMLIVSDGMGYAIKRVLSAHGLFDLPVIANRLLCSDSRGYALEFPYGNTWCPAGVCKCSVAASTASRILLIGDGRSDCCLAGSAAFVLAKEGKELARHCATHGYPHRTFGDFYDIRAELETAAEPFTKKGYPLLTPGRA
ncbi:MAG: MtnX-like HAD-IB family phosphatase [Deltaproteobacteria bacterium]|nr:MtnX-like HAD-IB family phosphatase [Deltaproteobacteria bacterium]